MHTSKNARYRGIAESAAAVMVMIYNALYCKVNPAIARSTWVEVDCKLALNLLFFLVVKHGEGHMGRSTTAILPCPNQGYT